MIAIPDLIRMLSIENQLIHDQTAGLTQADTLLQPQPSGNCMNWVLGHTLESQLTFLKVLGSSLPGGEPPLDQAGLDRYRRHSDPITGEGPGVWELERLLAGHDLVFAANTARLGQMADPDFAQEIQHNDRLVTRGWRVLFLHFHYTYHVGQLELLRQMAGHTEKVV